MLTIYGTPLCKDCAAFTKRLTEKNIAYDYIDITSNLQGLKDFLYLRDTDALFASVRGSGKIGIPCIRLEDGTWSLDWEAVLGEAAPAKASCSLDGSHSC